MYALPWGENTFDVVTSFRGIWGTTPEALDEARRVLKPGGRLGITVWGHIKASPGAWALSPFLLASEPKVEDQAAMVSLGRPGVGEAFFSIKASKRSLATRSLAFGSSQIQRPTRAHSRQQVPHTKLFRASGEEGFLRPPKHCARQQLREGLPLRASIAIVGYTAKKPPSGPKPSLQNAVPDSELASSRCPSLRCSTTYVR